MSREVLRRLFSARPYFDAIQDSAEQPPASLSPALGPLAHACRWNGWLRGSGVFPPAVQVCHAVRGGVMSTVYSTSRLGVRLAQVGRFTFALIVGALFGLAAWESPARETQDQLATPESWKAVEATIAFQPPWAIDQPVAPEDAPASAILPIGEAVGNKSHKKQQTAAAMPLRWSIDDETVPSRAATAQGEENAVRTADLRSRGPPARQANRSGRAPRLGRSPDPAGD